MKTWKERQTFFDREVDLYPVVSSPFCAGRSVTEVLEGIAAGGAKIVQIREKDMSGQKLFELVTACKRITDRAGMLLIVDDHTDVALAADADGKRGLLQNLLSLGAWDLKNVDKVVCQGLAP